MVVSLPLWVLVLLVAVAVGVGRLSSSSVSSTNNNRKKFWCPRCEKQQHQNVFVGNQQQGDDDDDDDFDDDERLCGGGKRRRGGWWWFFGRRIGRRGEGTVEELVKELRALEKRVEEQTKGSFLNAKVREILCDVEEEREENNTKTTKEEEDAEMMESSPTASTRESFETSRRKKEEQQQQEKKERGASANDEPVRAAERSAATSGNGSEPMSWTHTNANEEEEGEEITSPDDGFTKVTRKAERKEEMRRRRLEEDLEAERRREQTKREREEKKAREEAERMQNRVEDFKREKERTEKQDADIAMWRDLATKRLAEAGVYKLAEEGDLYAVLTLTMEDMASQIVNALKSIEEYYKKALKRFHPDTSRTIEQKVFNEETFKILRMSRDKWVEKGKPLSEKQPQTGPQTPREAKFSKRDAQSTGKKWSRATGSSGTRRGSPPSNGSNASSQTNGGFRDPFSNAQRHGFTNAAKKPFSTEQRKSNENQPSSPSTRL